MVGQSTLQNSITSMIKHNALPRFMIITGEKGSGKKTFVDYIHSSIDGAIMFNIGITVDAIRQAITQAHKLRGAVGVFLFADADNMSVQARNAMLKLAEEPPNNSYIIMTLEDINNTLPTIKSRAIVFEMERYTPQEIIEYASITYNENNEIYGDLCNTPGEVDLLYRVGAEDFYEYVVKVVDNIAEVNGSNVFKIADKIAFKSEDEDKYDLRLFLKVFIKVCMDRGEVDDFKATKITSSALSQLRITGINKQMLFDKWILEVRKAWR